MDPIPATRHALEELSRFEGDDLTTHLNTTTNLVAAIAPDCVAVTITYQPHHDLAFTWVSNALNGQALEAAATPESTTAPHKHHADNHAHAHNATPLRSDPLDERAWQQLAGAQNTLGIASTLTIPLTDGDATVGEVTMYGATPTTFDHRHQALADVCGGWADGAVTNADLSLASVTHAQHTPRMLANQLITAQAVGMLSARHHLHPDVARQHLHEAAQRAGLAVAELARRLLATRLL